MPSPRTGERANFDTHPRLVFGICKSDDVAQVAADTRARLIELHGITEFDVATGSVASQTRFAPHAHLLRLRVHAPGA